LTFLGRQIYQICLICSSIFHCQLMTITLTRHSCEIDLRYEKGKLALDRERRCEQDR
jgi:hypothetical protein